jgi:large subunit ribosomal protein L22
LLRSAVENANYVSAEKNLDVDVDRLYVKRAVANDGPRMKRIRPAPMGRAYRYQRRISHLEIALEEKASGNGKADLVETVEGAPVKKAAKKVVKKAPAKKAAGKKSAAKKSAAKKKGPAKHPARKK